MGLHYTGPLLEWLDGHHPEFMNDLNDLCGSWTGGNYRRRILRADMLSIPQRDQVAAD